MTFPPCVLKGGAGRWGRAGTSSASPTQGPREPCHLPGWGRAVPGTALRVQPGVAQTGPQGSQELNYSYASKNPKPTQQTQKVPTPISNHYQPSVRKIQLHTALPWISTGWGSPDYLVLYWTVDPSPGNGTKSANYLPSPMIFKQHAERAARTWAAQSEQGFSQIITIIMS